MKSNFKFAHIVFVYVLGIISISGCHPTLTPNPDLDETRIALSVKETIVSGQVSMLTEQASGQASLIQTPVDIEVQMPNPTVTTKPTDTYAPTQAEVPTDTPRPPETQMQPPTITAVTKPSFEEWLDSAEILIYEDIAGDPNRPRWIETALDNLNLQYIDTGSAVGEFDSQLTSSKEWDLIIYARENKQNTSGDLFTPIFDKFEQGAALIIEHWNLDEVHTANALTSVLSKCGIEFQDDWIGEPFEYQLLYAHNTDNTIHNQPNQDIRLTSFNQLTWTGDLGDLMRVVSGGNGELLFGARSAYDDSHGTVMSCFDNRFILQTHSTHQYEEARMVQLWENYIYNALLSRYSSLYQ
jgi:hypothetical protein